MSAPTAVVAHPARCDRVVAPSAPTAGRVFRGRIVEEGPVTRVMTAPQHDYTKLLLASVPVPDPNRRWTDRIELVDGMPQAIDAQTPPAGTGHAG
jgi:ABC-type oligopeptide transport system ATPase subunit